MAGRRSSALCLLVIAALLLGACKSSSSSSGTPPKTYIAGLCSAAYSWGSSIKTEIDQVKAEATSMTSLAEGRQLLVAFMGKIVDHTKTFISSVKALGSPAVENGQEFQNKLVSVLQSLRAKFQEAEAKTKTIPISGTAAFSGAAKQIFDSLNSASSSLSQFGLASNPELDSAFKADPTCAKAGAVFSSLGG